jgi:epoxyqueuosine reductase
VSVLPSADILGHARACGFALAGLARAERLDEEPLSRWLASGMHARMAWMAERVEERLDPRRILPEAKSVLALGCCVRTSAKVEGSAIALYAQGRDYHATMRDRLRALRRRLEALGVHGWAEVDTGPVLEKAWAARAGLGWLGKSGMLVTEEHGSHVVLAVMLLDCEVDRLDAPHADRCGTCTACLAACPAHALVSPGVVDARRCLSYQTIEERGEFAPALRPHARLAFGCDECQTSCPWNAPGHACDDARFAPRPVARASLLELAHLTPDGFQALTRGTAVRRAHYAGLRRNALVALGARRDPRVAEARPLADDPDETVRAAARWALAQLS